MKQLTLLIAILTMNITTAQDKVQKKIDGVFYELKHEEIREVKGKKYKDTYWIQVGVEHPRTRSILCKIPTRCKNIKVETINLNCIKNERSNSMGKEIRSK